MGAFLPLILSLAPGLIQLVEGIFQKKKLPVASPGDVPEKLGANKLDAVMSAILAVLGAVGKTPGMAPTAPPDNADLAHIIQSVFDQMKAKGEVTGALPSVVVGALPVRGLPPEVYQATQTLLSAVLLDLRR
ncbi:MAG: hypothetical protein NVS1B6_03180 [Steroidobacteraceae bacterium]